MASESACINAATAYNVTRTYTCRTSTTVAVTQSTAPPQSPPPSSGYTTKFDLTEFPISEGGRWHKANNPWTFVRSANGTAYGSNGVTNSYDDSYAYLSGLGSTDYTIEATVQVNATCADTCEVELLLRVTDDANNARLIEMDFWRNGTVQPARWNGPFGSYTTYNSSAAGCNVPWTQSIPLQTGDKIKAQASGSTSRAWHNGVLKVCVQDTTMAAGAPGIGFFIRPGVANNALTITDVTVTSP